MPHFILIDHSIQDTTGHHYEYAVRVLEAAEKAGYTPVLGVNVDFRVQQLPWKVYPLYPCGFWPRMGTTATSRTAAKAANSIANVIEAARVRLFFSRFGFLWLIRNEPIGYLRGHPFDSAIGTAFLSVAGAAYWAAHLIARFLLALIPFRGYFAGMFHSIWKLFKSSILQVLDALSPAGSLAYWRFARRKQKTFGRATHKLLSSLDIIGEDIVFIPTLAEPEMLGLLHCFQKNPRATMPSYHLLFRRNLYDGREPDFDRQEQALLPVRNAFLAFRAALSKQRVFFYTDTDDLSRQYNRLKIFKFRSCPIPHTVPASQHEPAVLPLRITYLGDARAEKGYHHLPGVVQNLWQSEVETGRARFVFQSNYNVTPGEAEAVIARSQLSVYPPEKVCLIKETCTSKEYRDLLLSADVIVLPYRADHYYARSSGVLIEALAAGIPVVVPATSWLGKQIADPSYRYLREVSQDERTIPPKRHHWIRQHPGLEHELVRVPADLRFGSEDKKVYTWLEVPPNSTCLFLRFQFEERLGEFVTCYVDQIGGQRDRLHLTTETLGPGCVEREAALAVRIHPQASRIWVALRNAYGDSLVTVHQPTIRFLMQRPGEAAIPTSAVGAMYSEDSAKGVTKALGEVLAHYDHYRKTAECFSHQVYEFHNAESLIRTLVGDGDPYGGQPHV